MAENSFPRFRRTFRVQVVSWEISLMARTGSSRARSRRRAPSSTIARTRAVVPTLRYVLTSDMFESPTMTWRRRYRSSSAWGSSRVLMIPRELVVAPEISW